MPFQQTSRQRPSQSAIAGMFPTQRPFDQPTPVVVATFSSSDQLDILALALEWATFHAWPKSGTTLPVSDVGGGSSGVVSTKTLAIGVSEGTGKGVKD